MNISERQRLSLLALLLIASLAAAGVTGLEGGEEGSAPPPARNSGASAPEQAQRLQVASLDPSAVIRREAVEPIKVDIFESRSWQPPPPPPAKSVAAPPPKPAAPALPFTYAGQLGDPATGKIIIYLSAPEQTYTVSAGDLVGEQYRLEAVADGQLTFVYLPMNAQQILAIPGK